MSKDYSEDRGSLEIVKELSDLVTSMIYDERFPFEVRQEYCNILNRDFKFIGLLSADLMYELNSGRRTSNEYLASIK